MVTAIVALQIERNRINEVAAQLAEIKGITEVYSVSGRYDLVAMLRTRDNDGLAEIITNDLLKVEGIRNSETMLAFRTYSKHDLDSMFAIGTA